MECIRHQIKNEKQKTKNKDRGGSTMATTRLAFQTLKEREREREREREQ